MCITSLGLVSDEVRGQLIHVYVTCLCTEEAGYREFMKIEMRSGRYNMVNAERLQAIQSEV